ncbi:MAG: hypothetical protein ACRDBM_17300 [Sporomusa sp.]
MSDKKQVVYDIDGFDVVTTALTDLLNLYPKLTEGEKIAFSYLDEDSGISYYPVSGAIIEGEREGITGHVTQTCLYPFYVIVRLAKPKESRKATIKEWLDDLGRWLEKQTLTINDEEYKIVDYPPLTGNRSIKTIARQTPAYLDSTSDNSVEDWAISITLKYINEFDR